MPTIPEPDDAHIGIQRVDGRRRVGFLDTEGGCQLAGIDDAVDLSFEENADERARIGSRDTDHTAQGESEKPGSESSANCRRRRPERGVVAKKQA